MTPIYTPPKQDEEKERALAAATKRREEGKMTEKFIGGENSRMKIEKEKE